LQLLEDEKKSQVDELVKERDLLRNREDSLQRQIEQMEHDLIKYPIPSRSIAMPLDIIALALTRVVFDKK
jgi:hypothetical protein